MYVGNPCGILSSHSNAYMSLTVLSRNYFVGLLHVLVITCIITCSDYQNYSSNLRTAHNDIIHRYTS